MTDGCSDQQNSNTSGNCHARAEVGNDDRKEKRADGGTDSAPGERQRDPGSSKIGRE
jgi:hypothetical protein